MSTDVASSTASLGKRKKSTIGLMGGASGSKPSEPVDGSGGRKGKGEESKSGKNGKGEVEADKSKRKSKTEESKTNGHGEAAGNVEEGGKSTKKSNKREEVAKPVVEVSSEEKGTKKGARKPKHAPQAAESESSSSSSEDEAPVKASEETNKKPVVPPKPGKSGSVTNVTPTTSPGSTTASTSATAATSTSPKTSRVKAPAAPPKRAAVDDSSESSSDDSESHTPTRGSSTAEDEKPPRAKHASKFVIKGSDESPTRGSGEASMMSDNSTSEEDTPIRPLAKATSTSASTKKTGGGKARKPSETESASPVADDTSSDSPHPSSTTASSEVSKNSPKPTHHLKGSSGGGKDPATGTGNANKASGTAVASSSNANPGAVRASSSGAGKGKDSKDHKDKEKDKKKHGLFGFLRKSSKKQNKYEGSGGAGRPSGTSSGAPKDSGAKDHHHGKEGTPDKRRTEEEKRTYTASCVTELPEDIQKKLKKSHLDEALLNRHFDVLCNVLHFLTKHSFRIPEQEREPRERRPYASQEMMDDAKLLLETTDTVKKFYKNIEFSGKGGFGRVFAAKDIATKKRVAIKKLPHGTEKDKKNNYCEIAFLSTCSHPNIVKFIRSWEFADKQEVWIVTEFLEGGTLSEAVKVHQFTERHIAYVAREILKALKYLHSLGYIHRDLKSGNVMMSIEGQIKLIDFGLCCDTVDGDRLQMLGSPYWIPPEMIKKKRHGCPADIWSFAVCVLEMYLKEPPHSDSRLYAMFTAASAGLVSAIPARASDTARDFLSKCLEINPKKRWTAEQLLAHPFVTAPKLEEGIRDVLRGVFVSNSLALSGI